MKTTFLLAALFCVSSAAHAASVQLPGHVPPFTATAVDLGPASPSAELKIRFWLKLHNPQKIEQDLAALYDRNSPRFHHWLSQQEFNTSFAPSADEVASVRDYAAAQGFLELAVDPGHWFVTTVGSVDAIQRAFHVTLHRYLLNGKEVISNTSDPIVDGAAAAVIQHIGGLNTRSAMPMIMQAGEPGDKAQGTPFVPGTVSGGSHETVCFRDAQTVTFTTNGAAPSATYSGTRYGSDLGSPAPHSPPCGYGAAEIRAAYGMDQLSARGLDGGGQTVVIVDSFGSPTVTADAAAHAALYGLPAPNLTVYQTEGPPVTGAWTALQQTWSEETSLDVEWAHAMAPGAALALVEAPTDSDDDLITGLAYAIESGLGNTISNSWGDYESTEDTATMDLYQVIFEAASLRGIAINFSSGDSGDFVTTLGYSDVLFPASSPMATSIGGTTLALSADRSVQFQIGWGINRTRIAQGTATSAQSAAEQNAPFDPPVKVGFSSGSGGGASRVYPKPSFQNGVVGTMRMQPDISYVADPYTGVEILWPSYDSSGNPQGPQLSVVGGTSLSCPMFSAMWAIANQAAGAPLGQVAPLVYGLPPSAIIDIVPLGSSNNVTGSVTDSTGTTDESALKLSFPETDAPFVSALYDNWVSPNYWYVQTFGTDSSLSTGPGWDNVTGLGVPNGGQFVDAVVAKARE